MYADGRTRTGTAKATAPSRQRVYQFHHIGCTNVSKYYLSSGESEGINGNDS